MAVIKSHNTNREIFLQEIDSDNKCVYSCLFSSFYPFDDFREDETEQEMVFYFPPPEYSNMAAYKIIPQFLFYLI